MTEVFLEWIKSSIIIKTLQFFGASLLFVNVCTVFMYFASYEQKKQTDRQTNRQTDRDTNRQT